MDPNTQNPKKSSVSRLSPGASQNMDDLKQKARALMLGLRAEPNSLPQSAIAYQVLESLIAAIDLPPGSVLSGEQIEQILGIGRTPVREALKLLQADGLVVLKQKTGVRIAAIEPQNQRKILQLRRPLEILANSLAIANGTERDREGLAVLADQLLAVGARQDAKGMMRLGTACYHHLLIMADNTYLQRPLLSAYSLSRRYYYTKLTGAEMMLKTTRLHFERFRCVIECRSIEAEIATNRLIDYFEELVTDEGPLS